MIGAAITEIPTGYRLIIYRQQFPPHHRMQAVTGHAMFNKETLHGIKEAVSVTWLNIRYDVAR